MLNLANFYIHPLRISEPENRIMHNTLIEIIDNKNPAKPKIEKLSIDFMAEDNNEFITFCGFVDYSFGEIIRYNKERYSYSVLGWNPLHWFPTNALWAMKWLYPGPQGSISRIIGVDELEHEDMTAASLILQVMEDWNRKLLD